MAITIFKGRHGLVAHYEEDRVIGQSLRVYGEWAEEEIYLLSHAVRPGDTVLDVGANVGSHAIAFARLVGGAGRVLAIDGQRRASDLLALNLLLNGAGNVTRIEGLVGRETGILHLEGEGSPENLGCMSFRDSVGRSERGASALPIALFSIDSLALPACRLVKIDVEGMELDVLAGAAQTIARHRPVIYFEQTSDTNFVEIATLLEEAGYRLHWHVANPYNRRNFRGHDGNIFGGTCEVNVLCLPDGETLDLPEAVTLHPVVDRRYAPPPSTTGTEGWSLPADAYRTVPEVSHRPGVVLPPDPARFVGRQDYELLEQQFLDLRRDRIRAQEIMNYQAGLLSGLAPAGATPREPVPA
ncbi:hypothetical protein OPKNFCMD_4365 [Methylobacterium crusticola]|uniref:Methyltransferase FkbM domain-containing protein n=1 Tax=Methylobacterium crusticola TaxID=1697972 RepID=A0ABQ4R3S2_9HYPH|nr:FkbM family methyltransferase [Methylobacterium crusticola]GJD51610.1 hypothetical protein OPKNFCMD_4365 [Methylobacterium crusticola]